MLAGLLGRRLMIGVDRLDYSKGLVERFRAYERFLETHPENQNRVTFLQIAPLSRTDVRAYSEIRRELEQDDRADQWSIRGHGLDANPLPEQAIFAHDVLMGFLRNALIGIVYAAARRHEPRREGICSRAGPVRSWSSRTVDAGWRRARTWRRRAGQPVRHTRAWLTRFSRPSHAAGRAARAAPVDDRYLAQELHSRLAHALSTRARCREGTRTCLT